MDKHVVLYLYCILHAHYLLIFWRRIFLWIATTPFPDIDTINMINQQVEPLLCEAWILSKIVLSAVIVVLYILFQFYFA